MVTEDIKCQSCGATDYLAKNKNGIIHCNLCCNENNDETGLECEPLPITKQNGDR